MLSVCKTRNKRRKMSATNEYSKNTNSLKIHAYTNEVAKQFQKTLKTWNIASNFTKFMFYLSQNNTKCKTLSLLMLNH